MLFFGEASLLPCRRSRVNPPVWKPQSEGPQGRHSAHPPGSADTRQSHLCCCHCPAAGAEATPIPALLLYAFHHCAYVLRHMWFL